MFLGLPITDNEVCKLAYKLERIYNPYCGYQDPYGCGVGGFKRINFMGDDCITYEFLSTDLFEHYDMHLVFTGVTRNSKRILKAVTENLDKVKPLLETCDEAYYLLSNKSYKCFLNLLNKSWRQKKATSSTIAENETIQIMDSVLETNKSVLAHRLVGAGNGGFFLTFSKPNTLTIPYESVKITVGTDGVYGKSI